MVMVPNRYKEFIATLTTLVHSGRVPPSRIDDAVRRILTVKCERGLFERPLTDRSLLSSVGSAEHRAVARPAVRQSLVLLKNDAHVAAREGSLARVHVAGRRRRHRQPVRRLDHHLAGRQRPDHHGHDHPGRVRATVGAGTTVTTDRDGSGAAGATVAIVVIGETPYAEGDGDRVDLALATEDAAAVARVAQTASRPWSS